MIDWIFISGRTWKGSAFGGKNRDFFSFLSAEAEIYLFLFRMEVG